MDQDATWYGGKPRPRRHCVWGHIAPPTERGTAAATFRPISIAGKRSPISATAELLLDFIHEYSPNRILQISLQLKLFNSLNFRVYFLSEHEVTHWIFLIFTNNMSNFAQLFVSSSNGSVVNANEYQLPTRYLNRVFKMSTSCSNTIEVMPVASEYAFRLRYSVYHSSKR